MLHTKYERSRLSGFKEENLLRFSYEKLISPGVWPFLARGDHNLNKLGKGPLVDATCQISNIWAFRFQRRRCLNKLLTGARTSHGRTHDGRRTNRYHKSSPWHFVPGELKMGNFYNGGLWGNFSF